MRATIEIDAQLLAEVKARAAESGRTLNEVVEEALRDALARRPAGEHTSRIELPTFSGSRLLPGVDFDDSAALLELIEGSNT